MKKNWMNMDKLKSYIKDLFLNVFVYSLIDLVFAAAFSALLAGIFYFLTPFQSSLIPFTPDDTLTAARILFLIYFLVIIYTSVNSFIRFKKSLAATDSNNRGEK